MFTVMSKEDKKALFDQAVDAITTGVLIDVDDASGSSNSVCIGDFRDNGWSARVATRDSLYYDWYGPNPIKVGGKIINPGQSTVEVDMDWS
jgi:hypothetical protein|tara:strand:- start:10141 stop:10413 length:273 start_codon:yes stop_codon:yes gene_type:complete